MDKYTVTLLSRAYQDLDEIYEYIAAKLSEPNIAEKLIDALEDTIFSLETMPNRGARRKTGLYATSGYRQLFVKNVAIVYRIDEVQKRVVVVTVRFSRSEF